MRSSVLAAAALLVVSLGSAAAGDPSPPMTEEEVVRRHVAGEPVETLVREIERRDPQFDLSSEMLLELRHAGVPEALIEAMRQRQVEQEPEAAEPPEEQAAPAAPRLTVTLGQKDGGSSGISIEKQVDPRLAEQWKLGDSPEDREFADLALYLVCRTPDHVPDHWRNKSPLGRDFFSMPRHRMLAFVAGSSNTGERTGGSKVRLELPPTLEVELEPGVAHDLRLGLAVQVGGRYYSWKHDTWDNLVLGDEGFELVATVKGRGLMRLEVEFQHEDDE